jgi:hypothetical protein
VREVRKVREVRRDFDFFKVKYFHHGIKFGRWNFDSLIYTMMFGDSDFVYWIEGAKPITVAREDQLVEEWLSEHHLGSK